MKKTKPYLEYFFPTIMRIDSILPDLLTDLPLDYIFYLILRNKGDEAE